MRGVCTEAHSDASADNSRGERLPGSRGYSRYVNNDKKASKVVVVGLDGATYRVLDPIMRAGAMPALSALCEEGTRTTLRSTIPTYTPPAWVSMVTGVNPGRHGIFGFLATTAQEETQIAHSGLIDAPPLWSYLNEMGVRAGVLNVPMYFPPTPVDGFMIGGGLAAGWSDISAPNFAADSKHTELVSQIAGGSYPLDTVVSYENDWDSLEVIDRITRVQSLRTKVLSSLLEKEDVDVVFAVFEGPDRLQHLHYQYLVEFSDWYDHPDAKEARDKATEFFAEVDKSIDALAQWAGSEGHVLIVSDHGFGPWEKTLNVNLLLQEWGYLKLPQVSKMTRTGFVAGTGQRIARRVIPRRWLHSMKARITRNVDWSQTRAFASHVAEQGIHVNVRGDLPLGSVDPGEASKIADEIVERLQELTDPDDGRPVVDTVVRREDAIAGPHTSRAPHLFPFCRDQHYELSDTIAATSAFTDHRDRPWGYHHKDGILVGAGPGLKTGEDAAGLDIVDVVPLLFHLAGLPVPEGLDGSVPSDILAGEAAERAVTTTGVEVEHERSEENPYSKEEEAAIEETLRGLGYVE